MSNYARLPVTFERGEGAWLWDEHGRKYLDALSGVAVCGLGHAHPAVTQAICDQANQLVHTSNLYSIKHQQRLAEELTALSRMQSSFFCNSGAEANEAALKIARLVGHARGIGIPTIVVTENSFHGRTLATLTATGNLKIQQGFEPLMPGFVRVPYNDVAALRALAKSDQNIVAVLLEPIQGESGVNIPDDDYLNQVRAICDTHDWLMMLDEVQTGMGRTGRWFAFQHHGIQPDVMTLAKGLGNGVPIGACLASGVAAAAFTPGSHGSTFGGNPLACRAALAVVDTMRRHELVERAAYLGNRILTTLQRELAGCGHVKAVRGKGLMIGVELDRPCAALVKQALEHGVLINVTAEKVIRLLPPLILTDAEADQISGTVSRLVTGFTH
ncbi:MAG: acetylornithine aminotransferase [Gammaproteobacteria bacterium]|nr:MAG: acetylornithine aminotransferase [Gammaproteobacteria bacterium]TND04494.1 MAG: acetylornithine aminotransferase [Gammaproteobacteria bacterium]